MSQLQKTPFEEAKLLSNAGFNWDCDDYYDKFGEEFHDFTPSIHGFPRAAYYPIPTIQLALKWLRDMKGRHAWVRTIWQSGQEIPTYQYQYKDNIKWISSMHYETYEVAELQALRETLKELLKT